jgi:hypothetical protein
LPIGNCDLSEMTCAAFIEKMYGRPQKMMILNDEDGTVSRKDSKRSPPKPKPTPINIDPIISFPVILDVLS